MNKQTPMVGLFASLACGCATDSITTTQNLVECYDTAAGIPYIEDDGTDDTETDEEPSR